MIQNYFSVKGENNMHYGEFSGDMPISALQAFGGYMSMGDMGLEGGLEAVKNFPITDSSLTSDSAKKRLKFYLADAAKGAANPGVGVAAVQIDIKDMFPLATYGSNPAYATFYKEFISAGTETSKKTGVTYDVYVTGKSKEEILNALQKLVDSGMSTAAKVMIGVGIVGLLAGGYYLYTKND